MKVTPLYLFAIGGTRYIVWRMDGNKGECVQFYYGIGHATRKAPYCDHWSITSALRAIGVHRMPQNVQFLYRESVTYTP